MTGPRAYHQVPVAEVISETEDSFSLVLAVPPELAAAFGIQSIPTLMIVRDQVAVFAQPGALPEAALTDVIGQARKLDMDEVRKAVAEQQAQAEQNGQ